MSSFIAPAFPALSAGCRHNEERTEGKQAAGRFFELCPAGHMRMERLTTYLSLQERM
jgi:hypothetical protein